MRLWSLHPKYLNAKGLVALWREALLAQAVLQGKTHGYRRHPQLDRFKAAKSPTAAIATYLRAVWTEAADRGYAFDRSKIGRAGEATSPTMGVTTGQLRYELEHLRAKLRERDPARLEGLRSVRRPVPHPMLHVRAGKVEAWERGARGAEDR